MHRAWWLRQVMLASILWHAIGIPVVLSSDVAQAMTNDPLLVKQKYLDAIRMPQAWEFIEKKSLNPITVAVVDTGVDFAHPDLAGVLLPGINLIDREKLPQDDVGHGTNVAGIIAAVADNKEGIAGIAPNVKILPIKAVNKNGIGNEELLSEGIRYAIDQGAQVVVLSLGFHLDSPDVQDVVVYAEQKNVVLVAATGNTQSVVMYPAAYATVVAVGGVKADPKAKSLSNFGQEIDVVAPWEVYTTALGGKYMNNEGTSMAAPQVAGIAALLLGMDDTLSAEDVRMRLRQAASNNKQHNWNANTGYGIVRADVALSTPLRNDGYEPNNSLRYATPLSAMDRSVAQLSGTDDVDWYAVTPTYLGEVSIQVRSRTDQPLPIEMVLDQGSQALPLRYSLANGDAIRLRSTAEPIWFALRINAKSKLPATTRLDYRITTQFFIYADLYEPNDRLSQPYFIPTTNTQITGTFHQVGDQDWYGVRIPARGVLRLRVTTNTPRIDAELYVVEQATNEDYRYDDGGDGEAEYSDTIAVQAGNYAIRVRNVKARFPLAVHGEYTLTIQYEQQFSDDNEPNNLKSQATAVSFDRTYKGLFHTSKDEDWFTFRLTQRSVVTIQLTQLPLNRYLYVALYGSPAKLFEAQRSVLDVATMTVKRELSAGVYHVRFMTDVAYKDRQYAVKFVRELVGATLPRKNVRANTK